MAINSKLLSKNACVVPKIKNGHGLFGKTKKNHSILKKPEWDRKWLKVKWYGKKYPKKYRVPKRGFASMSIPFNKKNWCPKVTV